MKISNRIGPPVEGKDFYGRQKELKIANRLLDAGNSLLLAAPRRIGKSSFAKKMISEKTLEGWKCVYIDLEEVNTEEQFLKYLIEAFSEKSIKKLEWNIPYFIQLIASKLSTTVTEDTIVQDDIDAVYIQLTKSDYLSTWVERLVEYSVERQSAMAILKLMCQAKDGATRKSLLPVYRSLHEDYSTEDADTKLSELLNMLENDGYIMKMDGKRYFRSPLIRDYWKEKYCSI